MSAVTTFKLSGNSYLVIAAIFFQWRRTRIKIFATEMRERNRHCRGKIMGKNWEKDREKISLHQHDFMGVAHVNMSPIEIEPIFEKPKCPI